jgi:hypothetical protein
MAWQLGLRFLKLEVTSIKVLHTYIFWSLGLILLLYYTLWFWIAGSCWTRSGWWFLVTCNIRPTNVLIFWLTKDTTRQLQVYNQCPTSVYQTFVWGLRACYLVIIFPFSPNFVIMTFQYKIIKWYDIFKNYTKGKLDPK